MCRLKLKCKPLDHLLDGGLECGVITEVYGEAGAGKTNFCLQASRECSSMGKKTVYIDTEGVSIKRLEQICERGYDFKEVLDEIVFFTPRSFKKQEEMINNAVKIKNVKLVVVDTINLLYRMSLQNEAEAATRSFIRQMSNLQMAASEKNLWVVITEQVYTDKNGEIKPFTNRETSYMVKTLLKFEKTGSAGKRQVTIIKHRLRSAGEKTFFKITQNGME